MNKETVNKLKELQELYANQIISEIEFQRLKKDVLSEETSVATQESTRVDAPVSAQTKPSKKSHKLLITFISLIIMVGFVGAGYVIYSSMNHIQKQEAEIKAMKDSTSDLTKEESKEEKNESQKDISEKQASVVKKTESKPVERTPQQNRNTEDLYTSDGVLKYATANPDYLDVRKKLLERWSAVTGASVANPLIRLSEIPDGFAVSNGKVPFGKIIDNGNGTYTFQEPERMGGPFHTVVTEKVD